MTGAGATHARACAWLRTSQINTVLQGHGLLPGVQELSAAVRKMLGAKDTCSRAIRSCHCATFQRSGEEVGGKGHGAAGGKGGGAVEEGREETTEVSLTGGGAGKGGRK